MITDMMSCPLVHQFKTHPLDSYYYSLHSLSDYRTIVSYLRDIAFGLLIWIMVVTRYTQWWLDLKYGHDVMVVDIGIHLNLLFIIWI